MDTTDTMPLGPSPRSQHVVDGLAVTRRSPSVQATTVVLVHGAMDRAASFGRTLRRLGDLDVIAYDRRGYAGSIDAGVAPDLATHVRDLDAVARWARPESLVVVGHSLGGLIALLASQDAFGGLPLKAVAAFEAPMPWLETDGGSGEATLAVARRDGYSAAAEYFYRAMVGDSTWQRLKDRDRADRLAEGPALVSELAAVRRPETGWSFDSVPATVHVARGATSSARLRAAAARMAELTDTRCEEVPGAGHGAHLSHPDEFARWIRAMA